MKSCLIVICVFLLTSCSRKTKDISKGVKAQTELHEHTLRQLNVQKSRARVRGTKLDEVIEENR